MARNNEHACAMLRFNSGLERENENIVLYTTLSFLK
jgi:hypothetical protein